MKNERLKKAIDYLRLQGKVSKDKDVAIAMGADPSNVSRALSSEPTDRFLRRFNEAFGNVFNINYLLGIEESMLIGSINDMKNGNNHIYNESLLAQKKCENEANNVNDLLRHENEFKEQQIKSLMNENQGKQRMIEILQQSNDQKDATILNLSHQINMLQKEINDLREKMKEMIVPYPRTPHHQFSDVQTDGFEEMK